MDEINVYNRNWSENLKKNKRKFLNPISKTYQLLSTIEILDGTKSIIKSYFGLSEFKCYEIVLKINQMTVVFFKKVIKDDEEENVSRWRYETSDSLEMPIEHFFYHLLNIPKKEAILCEELIENFPFIKMIHQLEKQKEDA